MDKLCRICLSISNPIECKLTDESETLNKLRTCFNIQITITDYFPYSLCEICIRTIEEFNVFRDNILHNERKLADMFREDKLDEFYENFNIKEEEQIFYIKEEFLEDFDHDYLSPVNNLPLIKQEKNTIKTEKKIGNNNEKVQQTPKKTVKKKVIKKAISKNKSKNDRQRGKPIDKDGANTDIPLKCFMCFNIYESKTELSKHYKNVHKEMTQEQVDEQTKNTHFVDKYTIVDNNDGINYKCNTCAESFDSTNEVIEHIKNHALERPYICKLCGVSFSRVNGIIDHGRVHGGPTYHCSFNCGFHTRYRNALRFHERRHNDDYNYKCKECGKGFMVKTRYEQHQNIHNNVKPFVCDICGLAFYLDNLLKEHKSKCHPESSAIGRLMCLQCRYICATKRRLDMHIKMAHGKADDLEHAKEDETDHLCHVCGKTFLKPCQLKDHTRKSHGVRSVCEICNFSTADKYNLKVHMRLKHNIGQKNKPQCDICGKFFVLRNSLLRHIKGQHLNIKLHRKKVCRKKVSSRNRPNDDISTMMILVQ